MFASVCTVPPGKAGSGAVGHLCTGGAGWQEHRGELPAGHRHLFGDGDGWYGGHQGYEAVQAPPIESGTHQHLCTVWLSHGGQHGTRTTLYGRRKVRR